MAKPGPEVAVMPLHFEDRSGVEFERLCLDYLLHAPCFTWKTIAWYGQLGGDRGRDIWAVRPTSCVFRPSRSAIPADTDHPFRPRRSPGA